MGQVKKKSRRESRPDSGGALTLDDLVLLRVWAGPATRADLQRDLVPLVKSQLSGTAFRQKAEQAITKFADASFLTDSRGKLEIQTPGAEVAARLVNGIERLREGWEGVLDLVLARALALENVSPAQCKAFDRPEGLAALIVQQHYQMPMARVQSANRLRAQLAVFALEQAFGQRIKTGLGKGTGLPARAGRLLAGELFDPPRTFSSDGKLILALAAAFVEAADESREGLIGGLIDRLMTEDSVASSSEPTQLKLIEGPGGGVFSTVQSTKSHKQLKGQTGEKSGDFSPPDLKEFSSAVVQAARPLAEGWPGNRKAFISQVWQAIRDGKIAWGLTEVAFKSMLTEAHRQGLIDLAGADLRGRANIQEMEDSKILYKNTVWHFVRVED